MLATGADPLSTRIKTDTIAHSANAPNIWMVQPVTMAAAVVQVHSLQMLGHKSDTVECRHDSTDDFKHTEYSKTINFLGFQLMKLTQLLNNVRKKKRKTLQNVLQSSSSNEYLN